MKKSFKNNEEYFKFINKNNVKVECLKIKNGLIKIIYSRSDNNE